METQKEIIKYCSNKIYNLIKKCFNFSDNEILENLQKNENFLFDLCYESALFDELIKNSYS